jgi:hypothetical protein
MDSCIFAFITVPRASKVGRQAPGRRVELHEATVVIWPPPRILLIIINNFVTIHHISAQNEYETFMAPAIQSKMAPSAPYPFAA